MNFLILLIHSFAFAFIPKASTIINRAVENNGTGVYNIELEVQFQGQQEPFILKEYWTIENDEKMKVVVSGTKELKDKLKWVFVYNNGVRNQNSVSAKAPKKVGIDFLEKYFHFRKPQDLENAIIQTKAVPASVFATKTYKPGKEPDFEADPYLTLARTSGVISYAFRNITDNPSESPAAFLFEQDQFLLRKFRIGNVEVNADRYSVFARGLNYPRVRTVKWNDSTVVIQTLHVQPRHEKSINFIIEPSTDEKAVDFGPLKTTIEEFYSRFR
jgi:hypothetical protein